jgi:hypothetical protein
MPHTFVVDAKNNSLSGGTPLNTGIVVGPGHLLTVSVPSDDTWSAGAGPRTSNANGLGNPLGNNFGTHPKGPFKFLFGSLVGTLDGGNTYFSVGTRLEMSIQVRGTLELVYWDVNNGDNTGSITATVEVYKGPTP